MSADQTLDWGPSDPNDPRQTKHVNPCMSTGFWFLQPTEASKKFLRDFIQLAVYELTEEVDQIVWNEVRLRCHPARQVREEKALTEQ